MRARRTVRRRDRLDAGPSVTEGRGVGNGAGPVPGVGVMQRSQRGARAAAVAWVAALLALVSVVPASAAGRSAEHQNDYLALGDSVPYGFDPLLVVPGVSPTAFVGYPQLASTLFHPGLTVTNAACPGETSTSLLTGTRPDNGCQDYRQFIGQLHVAYSGSQLSFAEAYVASHPRTRVVSLMIGANDLFRLQDSCIATAPTAIDQCILAGLPGLLATVGTNVATVYRDLRAAGFHGLFVAVTYYSTDYRDPVVSGAVAALDGVLARVTRAYGGTVADGFTAFARAAAPYGGDTCAAGLLIRLSATRCDVHPSPSGAAVLASTLAGVVRV